MNDLNDSYGNNIAPEMPWVIDLLLCEIQDLIYEAIFYLVTMTVRSENKNTYDITFELF